MANPKSVYAASGIDHKGTSGLDFTIALAKKKTDENGTVTQKVRHMSVVFNNITEIDELIAKLGELKRFHEKLKGHKKSPIK